MTDDHEENALSPLRGRFSSSLRFGGAEQLAVRLFDMAVLLVLLRSLSMSEIALFGVVTGMFVLFQLFGLVPETIILRCFPDWERTGRSRRALEALQWFALGRLLLLAGGASLAAMLLGTSGRALGYAAAYALAIQLNQLAELGRLVFRVKLKQRTIVIVDTVLRTLLLASMGVLLVSPHLATYLAIYASWAAASAAVWSGLLMRETGARFRPKGEHLGFLADSLKTFSVWQHLGGVATFTLYSIDPWIMSLLGVGQTTVGRYTVALKICGFFFLLPMFVQSMTTVLLVNVPDRGVWPRLLSRVLGTNALLALGQWLAFFVVGRPLVWLFGGGEAVDEIFQYALVINTGVLVLNLTRPIIGYLTAGADMREVFLKTYLPVCLAALVLYPAMISLWGAWGAALASLASYSLLAVALAALVRSHGLRLPAPRPDFRFLNELVRSW